MEDYVNVLKEAYSQLSSSNDYISVKDLAFCPRKKVYSKIDPVPMTDEEIYNYVSGQANHDVIARLFMMYPHRFGFEKFDIVILKEKSMFTIGYSII